jgi:hypothetical protein
MSATATTDAPPSLPEPNSFMKGLEARFNAAVNPSAIPVPAPEPVATPPPVPEPPPVAAPPTPAPEAPKADLTKPSAPAKRGLDALIDDPEPEAAAPEAAADDDMPPDATTPAAKNAWSAIKNEVKALKAEKQQWEVEKTKLSTAAKIGEADPLRRELESLKAEREEWQKEAAKFRVEQTDVYKEAVSKPLKRLGEAAASIAQRNEIPIEKLTMALQDPDEKSQNEKLSEIADNLSERDKVRLWTLAEEVSQVYARQDEIESNAQKALEEARARESQESETKSQQRRAAEMRAVADLKPKLASVAKALAQPGESPEQFTDRVLAAANTVPFDEQDHNQRAFAFASAELLPEAYTQLKSARAKIAALEKEIASYGNAGAGTSSGRSPASVPTPAAPGNFMDALAAKLAASGI